MEIEGEAGRSWGSATI